VGFTFDDGAAAKGETESLAAMRALLERNPRNAERIFPYLGGEEINTDPQQSHHRYVIDFFDRPLRRDASLQPWSAMDAGQKAQCRTIGVVPGDYPDEVAEDWPDLIEIVRRRVKPDRDLQKRNAIRLRWWQHEEKRPGLRRATASLQTLIALALISPNLAFAMVRTGPIFAHTSQLILLGIGGFSVLQSRVHEVWVRLLGSTFEDRIIYALTDCFRTFPFPEHFDHDTRLQSIGRRYDDFRARLMIGRGQGLTKTYNRFHEPHETSSDVAQLRGLHHDMDSAVLRAYGWDDLADRAVAEFLDERTEDDHKYQGRYFWPSDFRDEVLARLLALNAERAAAERAAGLTADAPEDEEPEEFSGS
jgi:hypothetical protein